MADIFKVTRRGVAAIGEAIEEVIPGSDSDPFAWFNQPDEIKRRAVANARKAYKDTFKVAANLRLGRTADGYWVD